MYDRYESTDGVDNAGPFSGIDEFTLDVDLNDRYDKRVEVDHIGLQAPSAVIGTSRSAAFEFASKQFNCAGVRNAPAAMIRYGHIQS